MLKFIKFAVWIGVLLVGVAVVYGYTGYRDARADSGTLEAKADRLLSVGRGGIGLGSGRQAMLLAVEDPAFLSHVGFDITTAGAGATTITQSLAKREGFADFTPGLKKLRQTGYALGLESMLTKPQILALFLETVPMGRGPDGASISGFYTASAVYFGKPPAELTDAEFATLVAVIIAPLDLTPAHPNPVLDTRVSRILALVDGTCAPSGHHDVWLEDCDITP